MRTLIFGANGQLGRQLQKVFKTAGEVHAYDLPEADICDDQSIQPIVEKVSPQLIINAAAFTDVDGAEDNLKTAFLVNETGARNVAELSAHHRIPVIYFSTDFVFDGEKDTPYLPTDPTGPLSIYGRSKAAGELATQRSNPLHFILRTAWLYGPGGNNFVEKILRAAKERDTLQVVEDEIGSPTNALDLAEAAFYLARTRHYGLYHAVNPGAASRYEFARAIVNGAELNTRVEPCAAGTFPVKAKRPKYGVLDNSTLEAACDYKMRPWKEALLDYLQKREDNA